MPEQKNSEQSETATANPWRCTPRSREALGMERISDVLFDLIDELTCDRLAVDVEGDRVALRSVVDGRRRTLFLIDPSDVRNLGTALLQAADRVAG